MPLPNTESFEAGWSVEGRPIPVSSLHCCGAAAPEAWLLILSSVHGDEPQGVWLMEAIRGKWAADYPWLRLGVALAGPMNPDGLARDQRLNANGVDLNRNLPTRDWKPDFEDDSNNPGPSPASEPETQALLRLMERYAPRAVISIHSMKRYQINCNGPAQAWSERLAAVCGYPVTDDIGYPCPGSFGTYSGAELQIPTITLEVDSQSPRDDVLRVHVPVLEAGAWCWEEKLATESTSCLA